MEKQIYTKSNQVAVEAYSKNPAAPKDLILLTYFVEKEDEAAFIAYYNTMILPYLQNNGVTDVVVWRYEIGEQIQFVFATSPTVPPWVGVIGLEELTNFIVDLPSVLKRRVDMDIHTQAVAGNLQGNP
jgi:hypothetical protein